ncbi:glycosyltransferase [Candidatus Uhrbacteria bacterium]|nr:glycosyltransferase [Candidatus Uhrbacteria bacterium]
MIKWEDVKIAKKVNLSRYTKAAPQSVKDIQESQTKLKGLNVLHVNATAQGGGVAELLHSQVAFERSAGINSRWLAMRAPKKFFAITKKIHNLLQGSRGRLTQEEKKYYLRVNKILAEKILAFLPDDCERTLLVVHDPQPLALYEYLPGGCWSILRLHIDLREPNSKVLDFLLPYMNNFPRIIISNANYEQSLVEVKTPLEVIEPAIDPLADKNKAMSRVQAGSILRKFGLDINKSLVTQVSRFDEFKDPMGVVKAFKKVKSKNRDAQLVLAGFAFAKDDPEAWEVYKKTKRLADDVDDVCLFIDPEALRKNKVSNDEFINALYTASDIVVQNSKREGFGLTITEAMWKAKPVIAGNAEGARLQISNNKNGLIVDSNNELAGAMDKLLNNKKLRADLGRAARESVKKQYLMPRYIYKHLRVYIKLMKSK